MISKIILDIRDYAFHYSKRQNGLEYAYCEYAIKMFGILSGYYLGIILLISHSVSYLFTFPSLTHYPILTRFFLGFCLSIIITWFLVKICWKEVRNKPIPEYLTNEDFSSKRTISWVILISGVIFFFACFALPVYFSGGTIHIGKFVIQREF